MAASATYFGAAPVHVLPKAHYWVFPTLFWALFASAARADDAASLFGEKVRPMLENRCLGCHSQATGTMNGGLALDWRGGWEKGGESGPAIVPGKPDESLLIDAVNRRGLEMPPDAHLSATEVAILVEWIKLGAQDPRTDAPVTVSDWWSLKSLERPALPQSDLHPIDAFIRAKLAEHNLSPAPEADRRVLIRRLTFDLHGLPPTPEEVDAFISDRDPHAYEALVDRLLASPRYGERMARLWLDVVHYGESDGYGMDRPRMDAWPYRDYVIRSFNDDTPYARFVREQLAADVLFPDEPGLVPALGFIAAGPFNQSALVEQTDGTLCKKIALNLDRDDLVSNVATTFLSVTLHCARCHNHKFDPISTRDYYRMQSVFAGVVRGHREFDTDPAVATQRKRWVAARLRVDGEGSLAALDAADRELLIPEIAAVENSLLEDQRRWHVLDVSARTESGTSVVLPLDDGSVRFDGDAPDKDTYTLEVTSGLESIAALRLEVLVDEKLPQRGPGRAPNGNLHLSEIVVSAAGAESPQIAAAVKVRAVSADFSSDGFPAGHLVDGRQDTSWSIHPQVGQSHQVVLLFETPVANPAGTHLTIKLEQLHGGQHLIGRVRLAATSEAAASSPLLSPDLLALLSMPANQRASVAPEQAVARLVLDRMLAALPPVQHVFAVGKDLPRVRNYYPPKEPYPIHILRRGDVTATVEEVQPGALEAVTAMPAVFTLPDLKDEAARRAALADWIVDERNPLTWRSIVNRIWGWHFDRALVPSANDFGRMGLPPSHPELLDWLSCEFRDSGGSLKRLHRLIVTSQTYRQSSPPMEDAARQDGDNSLVWRMNRRRIDAEQLRNALLAVSGKLDLTMGGPSAIQAKYSDPNPAVPPRVDYENFDPDDPASYRRGVYRFLIRNVNDSLLDAFDAANCSLSTAKRDTTVTPQQALSLFNSKFVLRQCEHLAARVQGEATGLPAQIERIYLLLYARPPSSEESLLIAGFAEQYGLAHACRALLNANEFLFIP